MKKILSLLFVVLLMIPINVDAKTLNDLKYDLTVKEDEWEENQRRLAELEKEIADLNASITNAITDIENTRTQIGETETEIEVKEIDIDEKRTDIAFKEEEINNKDGEVKDLLHFYQMTNGGMAYLEFVFGAKNISDFLNRIYTVSSITEYNTEVIEEVNNLVVELDTAIFELDEEIDALENLKQELEEKEAELTAMKAELNDLLSIAYSDKKVENDLSMELDVEIELMRETIELYEDLGCDPDVDVSTCVKTIPPDVAFLRPLEKGYVTSEYGYRVSPVGSSSNFHSGIDLGGMSVGTPVLAAAAGTVIATYYDKYGGYQVVVHHYIDGKEYSTLYAHLNKYYVSSGMNVTKDTVIGELGNTGSSTGPHLHFTILDGYFLLNYGWDKYLANTRDPRDFINFPSSRYVYFDNRLIEYN